MKTKARRKSRDWHPRRPKLASVSDSTRHVASPTAVAAEAMRTGVLPSTSRRRDEIPRAGETLRVGDPDDKSLANEYVGEDTPGGSTPTPDQNSVDDIGRAYGLQDEDAGELHAAAEILGRRDRHRPELKPRGARRSRLASAPAFPESLCHACAAPPRYVTSDRGSVFIFCPLLARYPAQPVRECEAFRPREAEPKSD